MKRWILEHGYKVFDFGFGVEDYKIRFSDTIKSLWCIYSAPSIFSREYIKGLY